MSLRGANDTEKLRDLSSFAYKDQGIWFLNAFWKDYGEKEAENVWSYSSKMSELDKDKGKEGSVLDEFQAHRFLELFKETLTVLQMREKLYGIGIEKTKSVPLIYYLIFHFNADWHYLVNAPQGDNQEEVKQAQKMLADVQTAFAQVQSTAEAAAQKEKDSIAADKAAKEAKAELEKSREELRAEEDAFNKRTQELQKKSEEGGVVQQNKAKAELAQHLAKDPLPLSRARITNEAAVKKSEKTAKAAEEAVAAAKAAKIAAEKAVDDARARVDEAEVYLNKVRSKPGSAGGSLWWLDRELHEARAYLPTAKGGYAKKAFKPE